MMKLLFPTSGNGDCIFCLAGKEDGTCFSMMIDCHVFTHEIKSILIDTLHCHLNYLMVTHIDVDHINGICNMLYQMPDLRIDHVIYNNLFIKEEQGLQVEPLTNFEKEQISNLISIVPKWKPMTEHKVAAKEVLALSTLIQKNWSNASGTKVRIKSDKQKNVAKLLADRRFRKMA